MKYGIITIGSQGDIDPFIALGKRLQSRGHHVRIAAFHKFEEYIRSEGFEYAPLAGDAVDVIRLLIGEQVSPFQYFYNLDTLLNPIKDEFLSDVVSACKGMDAILYSLLGAVAWHVADSLNIPCFRVFFFPADPTGEFPAMTAPGLPLGPVYNRFTFACGDFLWTHATRRLLNDWRKNLGLTKIRPFSFPYRNLHGKPIPTLYAYSPIVAPKPDEWDDDKHITGYWVRDSKTDWKPDKTLVNFLKTGSRPIYIGFGSMVGGSFQQILDIVLESLRITNQRTILSAGWGNLQEQHLPDYIHQVGFVPHEWLFQHVAAVVHHGGAGTTATGLRMGVPTIVVPFGGDQPYWGNRVHQLGVGPKPIPRKKLDAKCLSAAILQAINSQEIIANAKHIGEKLCAEDGVGKATDIIEHRTKIDNY
ncbi:glycosyltransferase [Sporanaerobacter sp. PP17-6a]|uniref:glycosyltransferase n=1 Tax=Sporanaerobacter sp. PP17-6a TaxID=1891289 RepID=UPI00089F94E4|nr:glycosyltransferase [Sporanaerobacter sp. PP17-6a]SCL94274.1 Desosaminyl transferase EryCIII precursor [Sporanaerobacter sp. PP17-6a]